MRVLVVGYGGREHALVWKLSQSKHNPEIFCAAGNPGIGALANIVPIDAANIVELADFASSINVNLTVVGPEIALDLGIVDEFTKRNLLIFGPTRSAAEIESSKVFAKEFMQERKIPTARFRIATSSEEAERVMNSGEFEFPLVLKADGLASGKGVVICHDKKEALESVELIMRSRKFGKSGDRIVIEEFLQGEEVSFHVISDGKRVLPLATSQDHKRLLAGDQGPNTGGMGAYSPAVYVNKELQISIMNDIIRPTISGLAEEGRPYRGVLYAGLILTEQGPKVLEFNARFGDPETQCLMPRMECDLVDVLTAAAQGHLEDVHVEWKKEASVCVVLCANGYPDKPEIGTAITGIEEAQQLENVIVFHAGTRSENGSVLTAGGRVLGVTASHPQLTGALELAYEAVSRIHFDGMYYRNDIAKRALDYLKQ